MRCRRWGLRRIAEEKHHRYRIPVPDPPAHPSTSNRVNRRFSYIRHLASGIRVPETLVNSAWQE